MKQVVYRSVNGVATKFLPTNIIRLAALNYNQLLRVLDYIRPDGIYEKEPLALVDKQYLPHGGVYAQRNFLKSILISKYLWDTQLAAHPEASPFISMVAIPDDLVLAEAKFSHLVTRTYPYQDRKTITVELDAAGLSNIGVAFDPATLISPYTPVSLDGDTGDLNFGAGHAYEIFPITIVTKSIYNVFQIRSTRENPSVSAMNKEIFAYLLHQDVATMLGITIPTV